MKRICILLTLFFLIAQPINAESPRQSQRLLLELNGSAVNDGMDIINLSLGNHVNGPDYPTSLAINQAIKHGATVVIANGNSGPDEWTVGSPATATDAISVGASTQSPIQKAGHSTTITRSYTKA